MPTFTYLARTAMGEPQAGTMEGASAEGVAAELRGRGWLVLQVQGVKEAAPADALSLNPLTWLPATSFDVELGLQQIASMLHSGLSLLSSLRTVSEQARRPRAGAVWRNVAERIEEGGTFSTALAAHPSVFPNHIIQLVRVGEQSGTLDNALTRGAEHLERTRAMKLLLVNALTYPLIVVILSVGVAAFMVVSVVPKIQKFLAGAGRALPPLTQMLMDVSNTTQRFLPQGLMLGSALIMALVLTHRYPPGRRIIDHTLLYIPVIGKLLRLAGTALFARGLSIMLESGVTLLDSLTTVEQLVSNRALAERVAAAREAVLRGGTLAGGLAGGRYFLPMLPRMVAVGETAGTLSSVLAEVARFHESQLVASIRRMSVLIEPVVIIVVGGIVGFVYAAFFVALFSLSGGAR